MMMQESTSGPCAHEAWLLGLQSLVTGRANDVPLLALHRAPAYLAACRHVKLEGFVGKVMSVLFSSFSEVLLLDSDNIPAMGEPTSRRPASAEGD